MNNRKIDFLFIEILILIYIEMDTKTNYINDGFIIKNQNGEDETIHIPYNINNKLITEADIIEILAKCNVSINKINHIEYFHAYIVFYHYLEEICKNLANILNVLLKLCSCFLYSC